MTGSTLKCGENGTPKGIVMTVYTNPPSECDICTVTITTEFVDGKTRMGPWGNMCPTCHKTHGVGLGTGKGQRYRKDDKGQFVKVEG